MINKFHMALRQFLLLAIMVMIGLTATAMPSRAEREGVMAPVKPVPAEMYGGIAGENNSRPVRLEISPRHTRQADILSFAGPVVVTVLDADGNPVSGVDVFFTPLLENAGCSVPDAVNKGLKFMAPDDPCLANTCPSYDRCGSKDECHRRTDAEGRAMVYVILGGVPRADYLVTAGFMDGDGNPVTRTVRFHSTDVAYWVCDDDTSPGGHLVKFELFPELGPYCGVPGDTIDLRAHLRLIIEQEKEHVIVCDNGRKCPHIYGTKEFTTNLNYNKARQVSFDADVVFHHQPDQDVRAGNVYTCRHTILPGVNTIPVTFTATVSREVTFTPCETCRKSRFRKTVKGEDAITVYGVGIGFINDRGENIGEVNVPVNEDSLAEQEINLTVQVTPAEYTPANCAVVIYKDSEPVSRIPVDIVDGRGRAIIEAGFACEQTAVYTAVIHVDNGIQNSWHLETPPDQRLTIKPFRPDRKPCKNSPTANGVGATRGRPTIGQPQEVAPTGRIDDLKPHKNYSPQWMVGFATRFITPDEQEKIKTCCRQEGFSYHDNQGAIFENAFPLIFTKDATENRAVVVSLRSCRTSSDDFMVTEIVDASTGVVLFYEVNKHDASENFCSQYIKPVLKTIKSYDQETIAEKSKGIRVGVGRGVPCNERYYHFIEALFNNPDICLLNRMNTDAILDIQNLSRSGRVSRSFKMQMGKIKGANFLCFANSIDKTSPDYLFKSEGGGGFDAAIIDVKDGDVVSRQTIASPADIDPFIDGLVKQLKHQK